MCITISHNKFSWFQIFTVFWMLYAFFWVIQMPGELPRRKQTTTNFFSFVSESYMFWSCGLSSGIQTQVKMHIDILKFWRVTNFTGYHRLKYKYFMYVLCASWLLCYACLWRWCWLACICLSIQLRVVLTGNLRFSWNQQVVIIPVVHILIVSY